MKKSIFCFLLLMLSFAVYSADEQLNILDMMQQFYSDPRSSLKYTRPGTVRDGKLYVNALMLDFLTPYNIDNVGNVQSIGSVTVPFTKSGILNYIAGTRDFIVGSIFDDDGKLLYPGTIAASIEESEAKAMLDNLTQKKALIEKSYDYIKRMTRAQENLAQKKYITTFELDQAEIQLMSALLESQSNIKNIDSAIENYKTPEIYSTNTGIVTNAFAQVGDNAFEGSPALELMQMDPVKIKVKFPVYLLNPVSGTERAVVFDNDGNSYEAVVESYQDDPENVYLYLRNKLRIKNNLTSNEVKYQKIYQVYPVYNLLNKEFLSDSLQNRADNESLLAVPADAIKHDEKGTYVYKILNADEYSIKTGAKTVVKFKKIYVDLDKITATIPVAGNETLKVKVIKLNDNNKLNELIQGDLVVGKSEPSLNEAKEAVIVDYDWIFYPGEQVKVAFPQYTFPGIYVPLSSVISSGTGDNYVYLIENSFLRLKKINVIGFYRDYCIISGAGLQRGNKILNIDTADLFEQIYDGRQVAIIETQEPPKFIEKEHAFNYIQSTLNYGIGGTSNKNNRNTIGFGNLNMLQNIGSMNGQKR